MNMKCTITYKYSGNKNLQRKQIIECDNFQLLHSEKIVNFMKIIEPCTSTQIKKYKTVLIVNFDAVESIKLIKEEDESNQN